MSGDIFINISNSRAIILEDDWQFTMVVLKHESCNQVLVDMKELDNNILNAYSARSLYFIPAMTRIIFFC